jgi:hypothetical protein
MKPLFLPVTSEVYEWYHHGKSWEIRPYRKLYTEKSVFNGRKVTVSRGYTKDRFKGVIDREPIVGTLEDILVQVPYDSLIPVAESNEEARAVILDLTNVEKYIAFHIKKK